MQQQGTGVMVVGLVALQRLKNSEEPVGGSGGEGRCGIQQVAAMGQLLI